MAAGDCSKAIDRGPSFNKGDREDPGNYRGITLQSVFRKVLIGPLHMTQ